jgi:hypothetical protein
LRQRLFQGRAGHADGRIRAGVHQGVGRGIQHPVQLAKLVGSHRGILLDRLAGRLGGHHFRFLGLALVEFRIGVERLVGATVALVGAVGLVALVGVIALVVGAIIGVAGTLAGGQGWRFEVEDGKADRGKHRDGKRHGGLA